MPIRSAWILAVAALAVVGADARAGETLDAVRGRGHLTCGVSADAAGLSRRDERGRYNGFEADLCRAVAAAVFGDAAKAQFRAVDTVGSFLADPEIDLVFHGLTWTFSRETGGTGVRFGPVVLYDGQAFMARQRLGAESLSRLRGRTVCVESGGEFAANLERAYGERGMALAAVPFGSLAEAEAAFFAGNCDVLTADSTELAAALIARAPGPDAYVILPDRISREPLAPLLRRGDEDLFDLVRWTIFALLDAEELGVTAASADRMGASEDRRVRGFAAAHSDRLGLPRGWTAAVVRSVGNYGELYERTLGEGSAARLARGQNELWSRGGLLYAPPFR
jgi:general L-amino acid transport system substrate-binding protein